jgi:hypothetical protein
MARIVYCHPSRSKYSYHIYTNLDFWDARGILKNLAIVKRNFGKEPSGDEFPTQVVGMELRRDTIKEIEKRLDKAVVSPPRHVIVRSMVFEGSFEFYPSKYYPARWSRSQILRFTYHRLPLDQSSLSNAYQTVKLTWVGDKLRIEKIPREKKHDPVIQTLGEAKRRLVVPSCF